MVRGSLLLCGVVSERAAGVLVVKAVAGVAHVQEGLLVVAGQLGQSWDQ